MDTSTLSWQWQSAAAADGGAAPADGDYAAIAEATAATFTPLQAHVGMYIRVCASFMDQHSTPASEGPLCSDGTVITEVQDPHTGMVTLAAAGVDLTMAGPNEDSAITASHDIMDGDGLATDPAPAWQWRMSATAAVAGYTDIDMATEASFTPLQAHVGMFLQACLSFADNNGNMEEECANTTMAVVNVNDAATMVEDTSFISYASGVTVATEDSQITAAASSANIADEDGIANATYAYAWQQAASADGPFAAIMDGENPVTTAAFTPGDDQVGQILRVCVSFLDDMNVAAMTGMGMDAMTVNSGAEMLCEATAAVANINDAPTAMANTIHVPASATAAAPHTFSADDFPFMDADNDVLASISIATAPAAGTLALEGTESPAYPLTVTAMQLTDGNLTWYPAEGLMDADDAYTSLMFTVTDDGDDGTDNMTSAAVALTIDLIASAQLAATGEPMVTAATGTAYNEDVELTAAKGDIADMNGIATELSWQWQQHAPVPVEGMPDTFTAPMADSTDWADIAGADEAMFTPLQAHVGQYIRACASFTDRAATPNAETRCSTFSEVMNVDDETTGAPALAVAAPYRTNLATTAALEGVEITASQGTIADEDGLPTDFVADWTWYTSPDAPSATSPTYTAISGAGATAMATSTYTPTQAQIGMYLRVCAAVEDSTGASVGSPRCYAPPHAIVNHNDVPTGALTITFATDITAATEDSAITAAQGTVADADGIDTSTIAWQWQQAAPAAVGMELSDSSFADIEGATNADTFTPLQANVGQVLRACLSYTDDMGSDEEVCATVVDSSGETPVASPVINVNDVPESPAAPSMCPLPPLPT